MFASHISTHLRHGLGAFALAFMLAATSLPASAGMENPKDTATVHGVKLDVDLLHRVAAASKDAMATLDGQDSVFYINDDDDKPRTVDDVVAELTANPGIVAALRRHQLDVRQYVLASIAFANGYIAAARIKSEGEQSWGQLDHWGVSKAHARFCLDHLDEIKNAL